ncbi:MAG: CHAP domain-containing protein [Bacteroidetes bacterium]|nr:CHAP domain-containing protein [Bacteroidota bacterium]
MKARSWIFLLTLTLILFVLCCFLFKSKGSIHHIKQGLFGNDTIGQPVDSLNGVIVYYNGSVSHTGERNISKDNYNIGLKYQCVEFVKRYYYEYYNHKMPDSYGHAKDFFDANTQDGQMNKSRDLTQYTNPSLSKPQIGDLVIFDGHISNQYGHVAIVSNVYENEVEIIQQNPGPYGKSRVKFDLIYKDKEYKIDEGRLMGWLRK